MQFFIRPIINHKGVDARSKHFPGGNLSSCRLDKEEVSFSGQICPKLPPNTPQQIASRQTYQSPRWLLREQPVKLLWSCWFLFQLRAGVEALAHFKWKKTTFCGSQRCQFLAVTGSWELTVEHAAYHFKVTGETGNRFALATCSCRLL